MNPSDIPVADILRGSLLSAVADLEIVEVTIIGYLHIHWIRKKSSPTNRLSCLALVCFRRRGVAQYLVAPLYKAGSKDQWGISEPDWSGQYNPPAPDFQFFDAAPTVEELRRLVARIRFYEIGSNDKVIESLGQALYHSTT